MELKRVNEYKRPEYPTVEESKNSILMMMVRSGKISLGVAVMCLLCNCSLAMSNMMPTAGIQPYDFTDGLNSPRIRTIQKLIDISGYVFFIGLVASVIFVILSQVSYMKCNEIVQKELLRKRRNLVLCIGTGVTVAIYVINCLLGWMQY